MRYFPLSLLYPICLVNINFSKPSFLMMCTRDVDCHFQILNVRVLFVSIFAKTLSLFSLWYSQHPPGKNLAFNNDGNIKLFKWWEIQVFLLLPLFTLYQTFCWYCKSLRDGLEARKWTSIVPAIQWQSWISKKPLKTCKNKKGAWFSCFKTPKK